LPRQLGNAGVIDEEVDCPIPELSCSVARNGRASRRRTAEQRDELAPLLFLTGFHRLSWSGKFGGSKRIGEQRVRGSLRCEISTQLTAA
jgi:hypothetical protein